MRKLERLLYIVTLLKTNKRVMVKDLASRCGVSERTIYRDMNDISGSNIPIYYDNGYRLRSDSVTPPSCFTEKEAKFLLDLLSRSSIARNSKNVKTAERIVTKIRSGFEQKP